MQVTLFMAQTINGIIARKNYQEDFLSHENWLSFKRLAEKTGCIIIGRNTYEKVQKWKDYNFSNIKALKIIVSKNKNLTLEKNCVLASSPKDALKEAKEKGFRKVLLAGGSKLNKSFMQERLIDDIILNIEPYILGKGIPTFSEGDFERNLELIKIKKLKQGILQLRYKVKR